MSLAQRLVQHVPRETSGSTSANRFDYQLDWALCRLLELHGREADYVLVLDYHDDVLVLDSASDPKTVMCYQVKSKKSGNWTAAGLVKRKPGKEKLLPSILGKLFQHTIDFGDAVIGLRFVTNAPLSSKDCNGDHTKDLMTVVYGDLADAERKKLREALTKECTGVTEDGLGRFSYERAHLAIDGHSMQCTGLLAEFLEKIPQATFVPVPAFYRALRDELARAAHYEGRPATFEQLCSVKATTRQRFQSMLVEACAEPRRADHAVELAFRLDSEGVAFRTVQLIKQATRRLVVERLDPANPELHDAITKVENAIKTATLDESLWTTIELIRTNVDLAPIESRFGLAYLQAMIGVALYETSKLPSPTKGTQEPKA